METIEIKGGVLEYIDETHTYIYDGVILPSITQLLKVKFGSKYNNIPKHILERASVLGTAVHKAIEDYEREGIEADLPEMNGYKLLKEEYKFECIANEVPIVLFRDGEAVACGRLDLVLKEGEKIGLGDIKRTYSLDRNYLTYQLNLYRMAYQQCYGTEIEFLKGLHLREDTRKYVTLSVNENLVEEILNEYFKGD